MKITILKIASLALILLPFHSLSAQEQQTTPTAAKQDLAKKIAASAQPLATSAPDPGERKFQANCSRCHTAPEQLSPRIVGTVVRHMRVRASLSAQDEQDILRYLAP
jgi:cytochrome c5